MLFKYAPNKMYYDRLRPMLIENFATLYLVTLRYQYRASILNLHSNE